MERGVVVALAVSALFILEGVACACHESSDAKPAVSTIVQALHPSGIRISVTDTPQIDAVIINANINTPIDKEQAQVKGSVIQHNDGLWTLEVGDVQLNPGDVVFYCVYIAFGQNGYYLSGNQPIHALVDPKCTPTPTTVNGKTACAGQLILDENFDTLNTSLWKHTIQFSDYPDIDFTTYTDSPENSFVKDGVLHLRPTLPNEDEILKPTKLRSCTYKGAETFYCERSPSGWDILPPTRSAQLTTKGTFSFKFGRVDIRAKTAAGAWLMSKLVLDPRVKTYGDFMHESGRIEMLRSRGDPSLLEPSGWVLGSQLNDPQIDIHACGRFLVIWKNCHLKFGKLYSDDMHVFSLIWTPQSITTSIDGNCVHVIKPPEGGFLENEQFRDKCPNGALKKGTRLAPFDKEFYLFIGLTVGGFHNYREGTTSAGVVKPWNDNDPKAWIKFWQKRDIWAPSWKSDMEVDYVKVWAI